MMQILSLNLHSALLFCLLLHLGTLLWPLVDFKFLKRNLQLFLVSPSPPSSLPGTRHSAKIL